MDITEITDQGLGLLLSGHNVCRFCRFVNLRPGEQTRVSVLCPHCGKPSKGGTAYFTHTIPVLIDLMQEYYHLQGKPRLRSSGFKEVSDNHKLAIIIFFCSLGEVLLRHFLDELMVALEFSFAERERLLDKYRYPRIRATKLFPRLAKVSWSTAVGCVAKGKEIDYKETMKFFLKVYDVRNKFLHRGNIYSIERSMPTDCIRQIWPLINLFVSLHNHYILSLYESRKSS